MTKRKLNDFDVYIWYKHTPLVPEKINVSPEGMFILEGLVDNPDIIKIQCQYLKVGYYV